MHALATIAGGDTLYIPAGTYNIGNVRLPSGSLSAYTTIRNAPGQTPLLIAPAGQSLFVISGQRVQLQGLSLQGSSDIIIDAAGSSYVKIIDCIIDGNGTAVAAIEAVDSIQKHNHLIQGCQILNCDAFALYHNGCDSIIYDSNVVCGNRNEMSMVYPGGISNLLIQGNFTQARGGPLGSLEIHWGSQAQSEPNCNGAIVRRNVCMDGSRYIYSIASAKGAKVYNNTLGKIDGGTLASGVIFMQQGSNAGENNNAGNSIKNNLFYITAGDQNSNACIRMDDSMNENWGQQFIDYNLYYNPNGTRIVGYGSTWPAPGQVQGWYGGMYDVHSIVQQDPMLTDPVLPETMTLAGKENFRPLSGSPAIDHGGPLTNVVGDGSGTVIVVADARYFTSGLGMIPGDVVRIGASQTATVTDRNIYSNTITVDSAVTWSNGEPVTLDYRGSAPDIGALEYDGPVTTAYQGAHLFYNNSAFDVVSDDYAIAPDKTPLVHGKATLANYSSYSRGINGVMIDISNLSVTPSASDFEFKVGNDSDPAGWATAVAPTISVASGAGVGGSDRIKLIWPDNTIRKQWLQITLKSSLGISAQQVLYFGNAVGDTGNSASDAQVSPADVTLVRAGTHTVAVNPAPINDNCDFDRDAKVGPTDELIARNNGTSSATAMQLMTVP